MRISESRLAIALIAMGSIAGRTDEEEPSYETVVRGSRPPLSAGSTEVEAEEIERSLPESGSETLSLVPGLRIVQHGAEGKGHQIFLRGFDAVHGSDVEVRVQGVSINERANVHGHGYVDLYGVIPETVREIRVDKGPFLPWQGDFATAGTVSFELGVPRELRPGVVRTEAGHRGRLRGAVVAAPESAPEDGFFAGEAVYDAGFGPNREAGRGALIASWSWRLAPGLRLEATGLGQLARWESPGAVRLEDAESGDLGFYGSYGQAGRGESDRILARVAVELDRGGTDLEIAVHGDLRRLELEDDFTGYLLYEESGDRRRQSQSGGAVGAAASLEQRLSGSYPVSLLAGLGWRLDAAEQDEDQVLSDGTPWLAGRDLLAQVHDVHAYAGLRLSPWRWLEVLPSVRVDVFVYDVEDHLEGRRGGEALGAISPRLAVALPLHDAISLFVDGGRGLRSPEPRSVLARAAGSVEDEELSRYAGGRPSVAAADALEAGATFGPARWLEIRAAWFGTWIEREIVFDHVSNTNLEMDGTRRLGVEAAAIVEPSSWLEIRADATWVDARFERSGNPVPGSAPWSGRAGLHLGERRGPHGGADLIWSGDRNLAHGAAASGYAVLDLSAGWRFEGFDVTASVDNATGSDVMDGVYHYASWFDRSEPRSSIPVIHYTAGRPLTARIVLTAFL